MNKITYTAAILSAALFSGAAFAEFDNEEDILTGNGSVSASARSPFVRFHSGPRGIENDLLHNLDEINPSGEISPFERISNDRDNRDDLIDLVS